MIRATIKRGLMALLIFGSLLRTDASALTITPEPMAASFQHADTVMAIQIEKADREIVAGTECGTHYAARVVRAFKSRAEDQEESKIEFDYFDGMSRGQYYLIFAHHQVKGPKKFRDAIASLPTSLGVPDAMINKQILTFACNAIVPRREFGWFTSWPILEYGIEMWEFLPRPWPESIHKTAKAPGLWSVSTEDLFAYLESLR